MLQTQTKNQQVQLHQDYHQNSQTRQVEKEPDMQQQQCQVSPGNEQKIALDTANLGGMIGMKIRRQKQLVA